VLDAPAMPRPQRLPRSENRKVHATARDAVDRFRKGLRRRLCRTRARRDKLVPRGRTRATGCRA
jgi:hypothetical protein